MYREREIYIYNYNFYIYRYVCLVFCLLNSTEITEQSHTFVVAVPAHLCSAYKYQNICLINYLYITE